MDTGLEIHFLGTCLPAEVKQSTPSLCSQTRLPEFVPQTISCTKIIQNTKQLSCMAEWTPSMISAFQWCTLSPRHATGPPKTDPLVFRNMLEMISQYTVKKVPLPLWNLSHWFIGKKKKKKDDEKVKSMTTPLSTQCKIKNISHPKGQVRSVPSTWANSQLYWISWCFLLMSFNKTKNTVFAKVGWHIKPT